MSVGVTELRSELRRHEDSLRWYVEARIPKGLRAVLTPEDVLQEVWLIASQRSSSVRSPDAMGAWLRRIAQRKLIDALRLATSRKRGGGKRTIRSAHGGTSSYVTLLRRLAAEQRTPSSEDAAREAAEAVKAALKQLPNEHRRALTLYYIRGLSREEVAHVLGRTLPSVNSVLYRGLRMLRDALGSPERFFNNS